MAIGRLSVGIGKKGKASPHSMYIAREDKYAKPDDDLEKLEATGIGNMPKWAEAEPNFFWQSSDNHERANGSSYREHVIALPRELTPYQRHELIKDWIEQEIGDKHAYQYAIHNPPAMDGKEQPHCHLMFSERTIDGIKRDPEQYFKRYNSKNPEKGGAKKANTGMKHADRKADLLAQRERWEQLCNNHLEKAGSNATISMKSNKERGLDVTPFNMPMSVFNRPDVKEIYAERLESKDEYRRAENHLMVIDVPQEIDSLMQEAENARQAQELERQAQEAENARQAQELERQAQEAENARQAQELERQAQEAENARQAQELERQAQEAENARQAQELERQAQEAENARQAQELERQAARKLSTPVDAPSIRNLGGNRFKVAFEDVHQYHDVLADKLDKRQIRSNQEAMSSSDYFYLCVQSACSELGNSMARRPDQHEIDKYETAYEAVDKLMSSIEQRMDDARLTAVTGEHEKATRQLNDVRQSIDTHSERIGIPIQPQQKPTLASPKPW